MKGFKMATFPISSPIFYGSGNFHFLCRSPLPFLSLLKYFGTKSTANCISSGKIKIELGNINGLELDDALSLYEDMVKMRPLPSVSQFNQLLSRVVKLKEYSTATCLFRGICSRGISVNEYTMSIAINSYCRSNRVDYGFSILGSFFKRGCVPNVVTFSTLLKGLFHENKIAEAQELFTKIVRQGLCELNVVIYGTVIDGLCKAGNTSSAFEMLRVMEDGSCKPNINAYSMVIDSLCKDKLIDSALKLFDELTEKGITPNVVTYNALICGLCNLNRWKQVKKLLEEMIDCKIYPDVVTFSTIVDALCKEGLVDEAEDVFHIMKQKNVVPDVITYNALMDGYCLQGQVDKARNVFYSMANEKIYPDVYSYNILINGYCRKMKIDDAMHLFHDMPRKGLKPTVGTYNSLLQGLFRGGRYFSALKLFDEIQVVGLKPDFYTYCILLEGLCMNGHPERALPLLETLEDNGERLHIEYYNIVICGFCRAKKHLQTARDIFNGLPCKGLEPDVVTYTILIKGCSENGLLEEARDLLLKMEHESNLSPNEHTYNAIISGILMNGEYDDASKFLEEMVARGFSPDPSIFMVLLQSVRKKEQNPAVFKMLKKFAPSILK